MSETRRFIVIFIYCLRSGGAERVAALLANELAEQEIRVAVITELGPETDLYPLVPAVERVVIGAQRGGNIIGKAVTLLRKAAAVRAFLKKRKPDALVSFMTRSNNIALMAHTGLGGRLVISERNDPRFRAEPAIDRLLRRLLYRRADVMVAQTATMQQVMSRRYGLRRTLCIPNPCVPAPGPPGANPRHGRRYVLAMGRLFRQKGFDVLIEAFAASRAAMDTDLVIAGEGEELERLRSQAAAAGIGDRVFFPGHVSEPAPLMAHCALFVLSSRYEGFPNVLLEAMSLGRPVISTRLPSGAHDFIKDGFNGLLVPPEDAAALADAVDRVLADGDLRQALGDRATGAVAHFSLPGIATAWREAALGPLTPA